MSESLKFNAESGHEAAPHADHLLPSPEKAEALRAGEEVDPQVQAAHARHEIAQTAEKASAPLERLQAAETADKPTQPLNVNQELKAITLNRELRNIRRKLPAPQRALSSLIHQPVIRAVSEAAGKTISRPSGLLGGGLVAFLGTSGYLYLTKSNGFDYNYLVFLALFVGGFVIGLGLELLVHLATHSHRHSND